MSSFKLPSKRLIASYVLDWVAIVILAGIGGGLSFVKTDRRPFSLLDLNISFPYVPESITTSTLVLVALLAPAVIIVVITLVLVPGQNARRSLSRSALIKCKLWELYTGITGLALSLAIGFFITQGLKVSFGKPRPHFLAICKPDLSNVQQHIVGGYGEDISVRWSLVGSSICTQTDSSTLKDGFKSFPSGHSSFSWSGLLYLSLYMSSKFAIAIPVLPQWFLKTSTPTENDSNGTELLPLHAPPATDPSAQNKYQQIPGDQTSRAAPIYNESAAPPNYGIILFLIPVAVATYISSTRYTQYWHFGFDIISGSIIGILSAWFAFRWYHLPIRRGRGWAWGSRSKTRAFGIGVGVANYVSSESSE